MRSSAWFITTSGFDRGFTMARKERQVEAKPIIEVKDFRAAYGGKTVVEKLNFNINAGEIFIIGGGSGCGKSTVLKHIIGLYEPAGGTILIDGENIHTSSGEERQRV